MVPPLNALRAFEAAARHLSFKQAAVELCVTQGAISRHIQRLEEFLGVRLFVRHHRQVELTTAGATYSREAHQALKHISRATADLTSSVNAVLRVKLPPTCAIRWLLPRLARFQAAYPDISVQVATSHGDADFAQEDIDVAIQYGGASEADVFVDQLFREELVPVCSRRLAQGGAGIAEPADLSRHVLLKSVLRREDWPNWFATVGLPPDFATEGEIALENASLTYEAAAKGFGVALAQVAFIQDELDAGTLVVPIDRHVTNPTGYYLLIPRERGRLRKTRAFRDWIMQEVSMLPPSMRPPA